MEFFAGFNEKIASCESMKSNVKMKIMAELKIKW